MSLDDEKSKWLVIKNQEFLHTDIVTSQTGVRKKVIPILEVKEIKEINYRRIMFQSLFDASINGILNNICLHFIRKTRCFDEIIILRTKETWFFPVYDFSLRDKDEDGIDNSEFEELAQIGKDLNTGDWRYLNQAEWSSFDMVWKINDDFLICVNNTALSIDELEANNPNWIFEEVQPIIEKTIAQLKDILTN